MSGSTEIEDSKGWLRCQLCIQLVVRPSLLSVLHNDDHDNYNGLKRDGSLLYNEIQNIEQKLTKKDKKFLKPDQWDIALPKDGSCFTDSIKFDPTIIKYFIRHGTTLPAPVGGWSDPDPLATNATSIETKVFAVCEAVKKRNELAHPQLLSIPKDDFDELWDSLEDIVKNLGYWSEHKDLMVKLKDGPLENYQQTQLEILLALADKPDRKEVKDLIKEEIGKLKDTDSFVLESVLDIICEEFDDWKKLAARLDIDDDGIETILSDDNLDTKGRMSKIFDMKKRQIKWSDLRDSLVQFDKEDLIEKIKRETLITVGLQKASRNLRTKYTNLLKDYTITEPLSRPGRPGSTVVEFEDAYVDLAILEAWEMDDCWRHSDLDHHKKANYLKKTSIKIDEIFPAESNKPEKKFVIIRGIAGIGKSMLTDSFTLRWAKDNMLIGKNGIDFLFKLKCMDLNEEEEKQGVENVLKKFFPEVFDHVSLKDLHEVANRVMILIDGIDELKDVHRFDLNKDNECMLGSVRKLLDINSDILPGHKTLLAGRPEVCGNIFSYFEKKGTVPNFVEICGFNEKNVKLYVEKHFCDDDEKKAGKVMQKLEESENLKMMASIPIYLWVICGLFKSEDVEAPQTTTELCAYACLVFIKKHGKIYDEDGQEIDITNLKLKELISDHPKVLHIIYLLAELSKSTLEERKVVFTEEKVKSFQSIDVSHTGFICKQRSNARHAKYQFKHLVLQEFFTSISLYLKPGLFSFKVEKECFKSCLPMVAGLCGIEKSFESITDEDELSPIQYFLKELKAYYYYNSNFITKMVTFFSERRKAKLLCHIEEKLLQQMRRDASKIVLEGASTDNLSAVFEHQGSFSQEFKSTVCSSPLEIKNILHHIDIRNMLYFINKAEVTNISNLHVETIEGRTFSENSIELFKRYYENTNDGVKTALWFEGMSSDAKTIRMTDYEDDKRRGVCIAITSSKNIDDNDELIAKIIGMAKVVYLDSSLQKLYRKVKEFIMKTMNSDSDKTIVVTCGGELTSSERMKSIDVETLEIIIDSNFRFSRKHQNMSLQVEGTANLASRFDEINCMFSIGLPDGFEANYIIEECAGLFNKIVLKSSVHTNYPAIKSYLPRDKLMFEDKQNRFEPISMSQFQFQIEAHLHLISNDRNVSLFLGRAKTEDGLLVEIASDENTDVVFKIYLGNKDGVEDVFTILTDFISSFSTVTIHASLGELRSDIISNLTEYPHDQILSVE